MDRSPTTRPAGGQTPGARGRRRLPTRVLLACAAIGAAGGLVVAPVTLFSSTGPALAMPLLFAVLAMVKLLPGTLAQGILRRGGVALLAGMIVGLVNIPFSAHGPMVFVSLAGIGLLQEIVPALGLYRRFGGWTLLASNLLAGAVSAWLGWRLFAADGIHGAVAIGYWACAAASIVAVTLLGLAIASRVRRSGVAGLDEEEDPDREEAA